jgi:TonB-linked SusC/RagA family outer membrane protein
MKKILLAFLVSWLLHGNYAMAQSRTISGRVFSQEDGSYIPGVSILLKGTSIGASTDIEGKFQLNVPGEGGTLVLSFIGLVRQEVEIGSRTEFNITMLPDSKQLSELVVTAFGIEREKKALGYTVQEISGESLAEVKTSNVLNNLSGKVAGVQITSNGGPGSGSHVVIRGSSSVSGNNQPLVVIDGVPIEQTTNNRYGGGISEVNPDDIASMTVLKGANAAALYGSRAANGVILITTKSGAGAKGIGVEVSSSATFERPLVKPRFQNMYGGGNGYRTWYNNGRSGRITDPGEIAQYRVAYGPSAPLTGTAGTDESWGAPLDGRLVRHWWTGTEVAPLVPQPNNWEEFWETGQTFSNNVALTGGNDQGNFRLSLGRLDQTGIMAFNDFQRNNISLNSSYKLTSKLRAVVSGEYIKSGSENRRFISGQEFIWSHRHISWGQLKNWRDYTGVHIQRPGDNLPPNWQHTFFINPFHREEFLPNKNDKDRLRGNIALNYTFNDKLSLMVRSGTDMWTDTRINVTRYERVSNGVYLGGQFSEEVLRNQETNHDFILTYSDNFGSDFSVTAQMGGIDRTNYFKQNFTQVRDMVIDRLYTLNNNATPNVNESTIERRQVQSLFGAAQFGYRDFLFLDVTGRNDWSSTLPIDNNSFFYPSVSLSSVLTEMLNVKNDVLSFAKLRASWAQVGNDAGPYQLAQVFDAKQPWNGSVATFSESLTIANSRLKPEITTGIEVGADVRLLGGRLGLDATYYSQSTKNQILGVEISKATGYHRRILNAGEITNKGVEVILTGTPVELASGLRWDVAFNFARNRNQVVELAEGLTTFTLHTQRGLTSEARVGQPYGTFYGNAFLRSPDGQMVYQNGIPVQAPGQTILGNIQPDWLGGISNTVSYKGFSVSALIDMKMGGDIFDEGTGTARWTGQYEETAIGREEGVIGKGVKNIGTAEDPVYVPNDVIADATLFYGYNNPRRYHEAAIFDGSYVKLREAVISYQLPKALAGHIRAQSARLSLVGRNLAILHKNTPHIDPEVDGQGGNRQGFTYGTLPSSRSIGLSLNVTF